MAVSAGQPLMVVAPMLGDGQLTACRASSLKAKIPILIFGSYHSEQHFSGRRRAEACKSEKTAKRAGLMALMTLP